MILFVGQQGAGAPLAAVRSDGAPVELPVTKIPFGGGGRFRFLPDGKRLIYIQGTVGAQDFWMLTLATGTARRLTRFSSPATMYAFDITPDGQHIVFDRLRQNSNLRLIDLPK